MGIACDIGPYFIFWVKGAFVILHFTPLLRRNYLFLSIPPVLEQRDKAAGRNIEQGKRGKKRKQVNQVLSLIYHHANRPESKRFGRSIKHMIQGKQKARALHSYNLKLRLQI